MMQYCFKIASYNIFNHGSGEISKDDRRSSRRRIEDILTETAKEIMAPYYDEAEFFNKLAEELAVRVK